LSNVFIRGNWKMDAKSLLQERCACTWNSWLRKSFVHPFLSFLPRPLILSKSVMFLSSSQPVFFLFCSFKHIIRHSNMHDLEFVRFKNSVIVGLWQPFCMQVLSKVNTKWCPFPYILIAQIILSHSMCFMVPWPWQYFVECR